MAKLVTRRIAFSFALAMALPVVALGGSNVTIPEEQLLHESLLDLNALAKGGLSLNELRSRIPDLIIKVDRMKRKGGGNDQLELAVLLFSGAVPLWNEMIENQARATQGTEADRNNYLSVSESLRGMRDSKFSSADMELGLYGTLLGLREANEKETETSKPHRKHGLANAASQASQ